MQKYFAIGNLTKDPVERATSSGKRCATFTIAVNERKGDDALFLNCTAWERTADPIIKWARKGTKMAIIGRISAHAYTGKGGEPRAQIDVTVDNFEFVGERRSDADDSGLQDSGMTPVDDDVPF